MPLLVSLVAWPSGLRRWFKAPVISMAWVRIPPLPHFFSKLIFSPLVVLKTRNQINNFALQKLVCIECNIPPSSDVYIEILDSTRIHPETYEWARKMAVDALEYDEVRVLLTGMHDIKQSSAGLYKGASMG